MVCTKSHHKKIYSNSNVSHAHSHSNNAVFLARSLVSSQINVNLIFLKAWTLIIIFIIFSEVVGLHI